MVSVCGVLQASPVCTTEAGSSHALSHGCCCDSAVLSWHVATSSLTDAMCIEMTVYAGGGRPVSLAAAHVSPSIVLMWPALAASIADCIQTNNKKRPKVWHAKGVSCCMTPAATTRQVEVLVNPPTPCIRYLADWLRIHGSRVASGAVRLCCSACSPWDW